jgi:ribosomal protein S18 acetylase RimI-like enzyme
MTQVDSPEVGSWQPGEAPAGVRLRPALMEEEAAVMALRRGCGWNAETVPQQFRAMREGRRQIWIAECEGYLVGTITIEWIADDRQLADGTSTAHISNLVVHPTYRRRGIGRGLIAAVEQAARRRGFRLMTIGVDEGNDYARRLYERLGYRFVKDVYAPWGRIHVLSRALDPAPAP